MLSPASEHGSIGSRDTVYRTDGKRNTGPVILGSRHGVDFHGRAARKEVATQLSPS